MTFTLLASKDRLRLGYLILAARRVKNWQELEGITAEEWLLKLGGEQVCLVVWEPVLIGKFGEYAEEVSAVWLWNKLKLRGGSRGRAGQEMLAYYKGGFSALSGQLTAAIEKCGGEVQLDTSVRAISSLGAQVNGLITSGVSFPHVPCCLRCHCHWQQAWLRLSPRKDTQTAYAVFAISPTSVSCYSSIAACRRCTG
jgi:protoporphyrinogen oxidase